MAQNFRRVDEVRDDEGFIAEGGYSAWDCDRCGSEVRHHRWQSDVDCPECSTPYNASGQRLRDDYRNNRSYTHGDVSDMDGFEVAALRSEGGL